jgi:hypothetical protein
MHIRVSSHFCFATFQGLVLISSLFDSRQTLNPEVVLCCVIKRLETWLVLTVSLVLLRAPNEVSSAFRVGCKLVWVLTVHLHDVYAHHWRLHPRSQRSTCLICIPLCPFVFNTICGNHMLWVVTRVIDQVYLDVCTEIGLWVMPSMSFNRASDARLWWPWVFETVNFERLLILRVYRVESLFLNRVFGITWLLI